MSHTRELDPRECCGPRFDVRCVGPGTRESRVPFSLSHFPYEVRAVRLSVLFFFIFYLNARFMVAKRKKSTPVVHRDFNSCDFNSCNVKRPFYRGRGMADGRDRKREYDSLTKALIASLTLLIGRCVRTCARHARPAFCVLCRIALRHSHADRRPLFEGRNCSPRCSV